MPDPNDKGNETGIRIGCDPPRTDGITAQPPAPRAELFEPAPFQRQPYVIGSVQERPFRWDRLIFRRLVIVFLFAILVGPLVAMLGLSWLWGALAVGIALVVDRIYEPNPDMLDFQEVLADRQPMFDDEMFERFFVATVVRRDVPGDVRRLYAEHLGCAPELLLPDDHVGPLLSRRKRARLAHALKETFDLRLAGSELTGLTIRTASMRVCGKGDSSLPDRLTTRFGPR